MHTNELARARGSGDNKRVLPCFILQMLIVRLCNHWLLKSVVLIIPSDSNRVISCRQWMGANQRCCFSTFWRSSLLFICCVKEWSAWWVWKQCYHDSLTGLRGDIPEFVPIAVQMQLKNYRAKMSLCCTTVTGHPRVPKTNLDNGGFG